MTTEEIIQITESLRHGYGSMMQTKEQYVEIVLYWQKEAWIYESMTSGQAKNNFEWYTKAKALERRVEELEKQIEDRPHD